MGKPRLLCVITGVPTERVDCISTLKKLIRRFDTTFCLAIREEFLTEGIQRIFKQELPDSHVLPLTRADSERAAALAPQILATVAFMWHERSAVCRHIDLYDYDFVLMTRADLLFAPFCLSVPHSSQDPRTLFLPRIMSWSGANDMFAFGRPEAMETYLTLFNFHIPKLAAAGNTVPETLIWQAIHESGLRISFLDRLYFILYREPLMAGFSLTELQTLAFLDPDRSTKKIPAQGLDSQERERWVQETKQVLSSEPLFPLFAPPYGGVFFPAEIDHQRDGIPFRFMGLHACFFRDFEEPIAPPSVSRSATMSRVGSPKT